MAIDPTSSFPLVPLSPSPSRLQPTERNDDRVGERARGSRAVERQSTELRAENADDRARGSFRPTGTPAVRLQEVPSNAPRGSILDIVV
jgi:hypothetical protein